MSEQATLFPVAPPPPPIENPASVIICHEEGEEAWVMLVPGHTDTPDRAKAFLIAEHPNVWGWALDPASVFITSTKPSRCRIVGAKSSDPDDFGLIILPGGWRGLLAWRPGDGRCWTFDISTAALWPESESEREWRTATE